MKRKDKDKEKKEKRRQEKLNWIIREWDLHSIDEAIAEAKHDYKLKLLLIECGIVFPKSNCG